MNTQQSIMLAVLVLGGGFLAYKLLSKKPFVPVAAHPVTGQPINAQGQTQAQADACPSGQEMTRAGCMTPCDVGLIRNDKTGNCECPGGQELTRAGCMAPCAPGEVRDDKTGNCGPSLGAYNFGGLGVYNPGILYNW